MRTFSYVYIFKILYYWKGHCKGLSKFYFLNKIQSTTCRKTSTWRSLCMLVVNEGKLVGMIIPHGKRGIYILPKTCLLQGLTCSLFLRRKNKSRATKGKNVWEPAFSPSAIPPMHWITQTISLPPTLYPKEFDTKYLRKLLTAYFLHVYSMFMYCS